MFDRLRRWLKRPVAWSAVLFSYFGILGGVAYVAAEDWSNDKQAVRVATLQRIAMVTSAQAAVRNACDFDNRRAGELRRGLKLFLEDHHQLHAQVNHLRQRANIDPLPLHKTNIRQIARGIRQISIRNCDVAASVITSNPNAPQIARKK